MKKLHKSIRKYAKFDLTKINELIEIDSYDLIKNFETATIVTIKQSLECLKTLDDIDSPREIFKTIQVFKHKTNNSFIIHTTNRIIAKYYYVSCCSDGIFRLHRIKKPAEISIKKLPERMLVELYYFANGKLHNDFGPAILAYTDYISTTKMELIELGYYRNSHHNKNGLVYYDTYNREKLIFKHNDITTTFVYKDNEVEEKANNLYIKIENNNSQQTINKSKNYFKHEHIRNNRYHRLNGPAFIERINCKAIIEWWINGKMIPDDIIHYEKGLEKNITKTDILKAMLFDREYGRFLQEKHETA